MTPRTVWLLVSLDTLDGVPILASTQDVYRSEARALEELHDAERLVREAVQLGYMSEPNRFAVLAAHVVKRGQYRTLDGQEILASD